jgi:hypothetical protein
MMGMKLSKGKISKAIHKNKQTLKKYKKNGRKNHKSKTFRKRHGVNLDRTTLKNYKSLIGGAPEEKKKKEKHVDVPVTEHLISEHPIVPVAEHLVVEHPIVPVAEHLVAEHPIVPVAEHLVAEHPVTENNKEVVSDINIAKTDEIVKPEEDVSEMTKSGEESAPKILTHEEIITAVPAPEIVNSKELAPEIVKPEEIITSAPVPEPVNPEELAPEIVKPEEIKSEEIVASAPQDIEKTTTQEQPIVEAVPVAPNQTSVMVESIDKLADYIAERIKQKLQEQSDNDPFTKVTTANANISQ